MSESKSFLVTIIKWSIKGSHLLIDYMYDDNVNLLCAGGNTSYQVILTFISDLHSWMLFDNT